MHLRLGDTFFWVIKYVVVPVAIFMAIFVLPGLSASVADQADQHDISGPPSELLNVRGGSTKASIGEVLHGPFLAVTVERAYASENGGVQYALTDEERYLIAIELQVRNKVARPLPSFHIPQFFLTLEDGSTVFPDNMATEIYRIQNELDQGRNFELPPLGRHDDVMVFSVSLTENLGIACINVEFQQSTYCVDPASRGPA